MAETLGDFFDRVIADGEPEFRAEPWYNRQGDCFIYHWCADEFYREFIDDKVTIYRSVKTNEAVGCQIKGVSALVKKLGGFGISLSNAADGAPLALFVLVSQNAASGSRLDAEKRANTYRYLVEQVAQTKVEIPELIEA